MYKYSRAKNLPYFITLQCPISVVHEIQNCIPEHKRRIKTIKHITDISTLKQYPPITEYEHTRNTYQARTRNKGHTNTKKINHTFVVVVILECSLHLHPTEYHITTHANGYKYSIIISIYIMYTRIAAKSKEIRFIYCTLCQFCA